VMRTTPMDGVGCTGIVGGYWRMLSWKRSTAPSAWAEAWTMQTR
jgi:hypothetical protein